MIATLVIALLVLAGVIVELIVPGKPVYHSGWYNVAIVALVVILAMRMRAVLVPLKTARARVGASMAAFGIAIVAFAGVASGLLGPNAHTIVGAPGERVRADELGGTLVFPFAHQATTPVASLQRGSGSLPIDGRRYVGAFVLHPVLRTVVEVTAFDAHDTHLTITQPTGNAFLSPVLMMQGHQSISGFDLAFDSFAVPAAHRQVKVVLFPARIAAQLPGFDAPADTDVLLFDVQNERGDELHGGIGATPDGRAVTLAGLTLRPNVLVYPAIEVFSSPHVGAVLLGLLAVLAGVLTFVLPAGRIARP